MKKVIVILFVLIMVIVIPNTVCAVSVGEDIPLSEASDEAISVFLEENGVSIPGGDNHLDYWMEFIRSTIEIVEKNGKVEYVYNWPATQLFSEAIEHAVQEYYGIVESEISVFSVNRYSLKDSEPVYTEWDDDYLRYNCYAYALWEVADWRYVGFSKGLDEDYYLNNPMPSITSLKDYVLSDLQHNSLGFNCVKYTTSRPTSAHIPSGAMVMCLRSGTYDFHFMRLSGSSWYHKPANTAPLRFLYSSPSAKVWTNERYFKGVAYAGNTTYDSAIYYFVYRQNHSFSTQHLTGEEYHSNGRHYYKVEYVCNNCDEPSGTYQWISRECDGPPCAILTSTGAEAIYE